VCDLETSAIWVPRPDLGCGATEKKNMLVWTAFSWLWIGSNVELF